MSSDSESNNSDASTMMSSSSSTAKVSTNSDGPRVPLSTSQENSSTKPPSTNITSRSHFYQLPAEKEERLRALYKQLDANNDGRIDIDDLTAIMKHRMPNIPESPTYAKEIMERADSSKNEEIEFSEFVHYVLEHEKKLAVTFRDLDRNADGYIDSKEIKSYFHRLGMVDVTDAEAEQIVRKMDKSNSKSISLDDFQRYFLLHPSSAGVDIAKYWRRSLYIDIGEDIGVPVEGVAKGALLRHLFAGGVAGAVSRTTTAPLDRLKVFLQVYASRNNGYRVVTSFQFLLKEGGLRALWRGNGVNVMKIIPESAIKFGVYEEAKQLIKRSRSNHSGELSVVERFFAGSTAGAVSQTVIYPLEVLKTRLALRKTGEMNRGIWDAFKTIRKNEGIRAFGRGYFPNLLGIIPYAGTDLAVYETLKKTIMRWRPESEPNVLVVLGCGVCSSACGQLVSYPLALVRTRLQAHALPVAATQPDTMVGQFNYIIRHEGISGLYRGLTPNFMKVLPAVGISYAVYESLRKRLGVEMT